jgi:hypothetical protein
MSILKSNTTSSPPHKAHPGRGGGRPRRFYTAESTNLVVIGDHRYRGQRGVSHYEDLILFCFDITLAKSGAQAADHETRLFGAVTRVIQLLTVLQKKKKKKGDLLGILATVCWLTFGTL